MRKLSLVLFLLVAAVAPTRAAHVGPPPAETILGVPKDEFLVTSLAAVGAASAIAIGSGNAAAVIGVLYVGHLVAEVVIIGSSAGAYYLWPWAKTDDAPLMTPDNLFEEEGL